MPVSRGNLGGGGRGSVPVVPTATPVRHTGRWRLSNWRLRWKLLVVLLVPLVTAVALGALRVTGQLQNANVFDQISEQVSLGSSLSNVMDSVEREREQLTLFVASHGAAGAGPGGAATAQVDASVAAFRQQANAATGLDTRTQTLVRSALNALSDLEALRTSASSSKYPEIDVLTGYNQIMNTLLQSSQLVTAGAPDPRINQIASGLYDLRHAKDQFTAANAVLMVTVTPTQGQQSTGAGVFIAGTENLLNAAEAQYRAAVTAFNAEASKADQQMFLDTVAGPEVDTRAQLLTLIQAMADANQGAPPGVLPATVQEAGDGAANLIHDAEQNLNTELRTATSQLSTQAKNQALRDGGILAGALLIAFLVTLLVARSLVLSLRRLRAGALEIARTRLPQSVQRILADPDPIKASNEAVEPVPVFTADEIGEVARSFDVVHGQAVRLAAEQAVLRDNVNAIFINLSRRSQALVERQLALIDRLEKDEQDPDQLANLFELDHLATRMRRNSESLLVLSGSGLAKRMSRPVPIGELVGAAVSEVEQYARIDVGGPPAASVLGRVVNDLIHLIAELLDNATSYSEPNTRVSVRIARTRARELAIQITDRGVGMSEDDIRQANERLANPPDIDVGVTRRMGLYVVARLARRHNIRIKLRANEDIDGGTVALIIIPEDLVHRAGDESAPLSPSEPLISTSMPGIGDTFPPISTATPAPQSDLAGAASAAAGIAGAFGVASSRAGVRDEQTPSAARDSILGGRAEPAVAEAAALSDEPATSYWTSDFEPSGRLDVAPEPEPEPEPEPYQPPQASNAASLWEAHTAVDAVTVEPPAQEWQPDPSSRPDVDAPTERLPIYEAVLSQWFRADEAAAARAAAAGHPKAPEAPAPEEAPRQPVAEAPPAAPEAPAAKPTAPGGLPTRVPGKAGAAAGFGIDRASTDSSESNGSATSAFSPVGATNGTNGTNGVTHHEPNGATNGRADDWAETNGSGVETTWESPADEGWQRAEALLAPVSDVTTAGLPKRVPKAHLVPGSAAPRPDSNGSDQAQATMVAAPPLPPRTAEAVRGRMSSFQRGLRRGRHAMLEDYSGQASPSTAHRADEEQE